MNAPHISVPSTDTASVPDTLARILADKAREVAERMSITCLLYTSPSPRDVEESRMPSSA